MAVDKRIQYRDVVEGSPQERQLASDNYDAGKAKEAKANMYIMFFIFILYNKYITKIPYSQQNPIYFFSTLKG